jgi:hypothetical protein
MGSAVGAVYDYVTTATVAAVAAASFVVGD